MRSDNQRSSSALRTIVVPTDFSIPAQRALEWAVSLATLHQARIVLVHAMQPTLIGGSNVERMLNESSTLRLKQASEPVIDARLALTTDCRSGRPWVVVRDAARSANADLIVMGSRGLTGLDRVLLGSTTDRVLRTATQPVLTVHPDDARPALRHVLLATDFSDSARAALTLVRQILHAVTNEVLVTLLHVSMPPYVIGGLDVPVSLMPDWAGIDHEARRNLETLADGIRSEHVKVMTEVIRGSPVHAILEQARLRHVDMIAVGTRGATGIDRFLLGSTAERIIHHANCPVLTVHLPAAESSAEST